MKPTIIIVDDVLEIREELFEVLKPEFEVLARVSDGPSAVKAIRTYEPDLVVIDVVMPGMSGIEVIREVRKGAGPHPKFVVVSGVREQHIMVEAMQAGAGDYLYKPAPSTVLLDALRRQLSLRGGTQSTIPNP